LQDQGEEKGAAGIPLADPPLGGEGGRLGGLPLDDEELVGLERPGGEGEEPWRSTSDRLQQSLPRNAVESVLEVKLQGHVVGAAEKACAERMAHALAPPWDADAELYGGQDRNRVGAGCHGAEAGEPYLAYGNRPHAQAPGFLEGDEGRGNQRREIGEVAAHEEIQEVEDGGGGSWGGAGGRTNVIVRPPAETLS
jgi:hypothetical protein